MQQSMCNEQKAFTNLDKDKQSIVYTTVKYSTKSIGIGEVVLNAKLNKKEKNSMKLKDTLCVPCLRNNLLSVAKVRNNGYTITFKKHQAMVNRSDGLVALTATKYNDLYVVNYKEEQAILVDNLV